MDDGPHSANQLRKDLIVTAYAGGRREPREYLHQLAIALRQEEDKDRDDQPSVEQVH